MLSDDEKKAATAMYVGRRIKFLAHDSPDPRPLEYGQMGTCTSIDDVGTLHMAWDNGRSLGLVLGADTFAVIGRDSLPTAA